VFTNVITEEGGLALKFLQFRHVMIMFSRHYRNMTSKFFVDSLFDSQCTHAFKTANNFYGVSGHDARVGPGEKALYALISMVWHDQLGFDTELENRNSASDSIKKIIRKQLTDSLDQEVHLETSMQFVDAERDNVCHDQDGSLSNESTDAYEDGVIEVASTLGN
jgi:hypothetical protein